MCWCRTTGGSTATPSKPRCPRTERAMAYWDEGNPAEEYAVPGDIVDAVFSISCRSLPVDHAYALSQAIRAELPWFAAEARAGLQDRKSTRLKSSHGYISYAVF